MATISREFLMGVVFSTDPNRYATINGMLPEKTIFDVNELNSIFRYALSCQVTDNTQAARSHLYDPDEPLYWIETFRQYVLPALTIR